MMAIHNDNITSEFTLDELKILDATLSEREIEMFNKLSNISAHKYIKILRIRGKLKGLINLVKNKQREEKGLINRLKEDKQVFIVEELLPEYNEAGLATGRGLLKGYIIDHNGMTRPLELKVEEFCYYGTD